MQPDCQATFWVARTLVTIRLRTRPETLGVWSKWPSPLRRGFPVSCCVAGVECAGKPQEGLSRAGFSVCIHHTSVSCFSGDFTVLKDLFYVHEGLPARTSVHSAHPWRLQYSEEEDASPGTGLIGGCKQTCPLLEQHIPLAAEPPLQPESVFKWKSCATMPGSLGNLVYRSPSGEGANTSALSLGAG